MAEKVALITGSARGIGQGIARALAGEYRLVLSATRETVEIPEDLQEKAIYLKCDISLAEDRSRMLQHAANEYCEDTLRRMEEAVAEAYDEVKRSRSRFRSALTGAERSERPQSGRRPMYDAEADE